MKREFLLYFLLSAGIMLTSACANHSEINKTTSTFYVIQPAEHFHAFNGHLNWYGRMRSGDLMRFLKDSNIYRIYRSAFSRAIETVDSLQALQKIDVIVYDIDSVADNIYRLLRQNEDFGRNILIVSPPGEIDAIVKKLGVDSFDQPNHKNQFNVIYLLINDHGKATISRKIFGKAPRPVPDTSSKD